MKKSILITLCILMVVLFTTGCTSSNTEETTAETTVVTPEETAEETQAVNPVENSAVDQVAKTKVFVNADWVKSVIDGNQPESEDFKIIEVAWGTAKDDKAYNEAHIPGAVHLNTDEIEEPMYWNIRTGEEIEKVMANYGITKDTTVIVYGADSGATRAAFVCLWAGVENVKVLDGGIDAWKVAGYATNDGVEEAVATTNAFGTTVPAHPEYVLAFPEDVTAEMAKNDQFRLVSIRSLDEFEGKTSGYSYIERAGEPEGALWGHDEPDYRNEDGTFIEFEKAVSMWNEQGITQDNEIAFYCGTGWRATIPFLMAYENDWKNIKLFDGGWFVWQMDEKNPIQTISPEEAKARYQ